MDGAMGGGGAELTGEVGPELSLPWGTGPRPLYWPMNEPSSLNWMSTLSPYSARESSLPSLLSPHSDGWLSERFSSPSLRKKHQLSKQTLKSIDITTTVTGSAACM